MGQRPTVDILLATWNGEPFLAQQLESLLSQTFVDWRLILRDDNSTDGTQTIISDYAVKLGARLSVVENSEGNLGAKENFSALMGKVTAPYAMYCDQDDVWLPSKIEHYLAGIHELELKYGRDTPLLLFGDLTATDDSLNVIAPSLWKYKNVNPTRETKLSRLLLRNIVTGCACIMNQSLVQLAKPIPNEARMHDAWVALVAASCGRLAWLNEPLVLYRQHGRNVVGMRTWPKLLWQLIREPLDQWMDQKRFLHSSQIQARALYATHSSLMSEADRELVSVFANLSGAGPLRKRCQLIMHGILYEGVARNLLLMAIV